VTFIGIFIVIGTLFAARGFGTLELARLRGSGRPEIRGPVWDRSHTSGFWSKAFSTLLNPHYWLYLLHGLVVNFAVGLFTWIVTFVWTVVALSGTTFWIFSRWIPNNDGWTLYDWVRRYFLPGWQADPALAENVLYLVVGAIFLALLPFVTRGMTMLHYLIALGMLGRFRVAELQGEVADLSASRTAAVSAEGTALRRLERDIHDGPQQRLVRLQMDLAAADRQLDADPQSARRLIEGALDQSKEALEELRALSRGFAPPILLDRGLIAALESLALRSTVPVTLHSEIESGATVPQEVERNAYFVASELVTNVIKHASAHRAELRVTLAHEVGGAAPRLVVAVEDDGEGGATVVVGHGLAGLEERLRGLGGTLTIHSPAGGPTRVVGVIPAG
jgi:signal transduction histidine kinase